MDKLDKMFQLQEAFDDRIADLPGVMTDEETWTERLAVFMMVEGAELLESTDWAWWRPDGRWDRENAIEESVDILHGLLSLWNHLGLTPEEVFLAYTDKNQENFRRQDGESERDYSRGKKGYEIYEKEGGGGARGGFMRGGFGAWEDKVELVYKDLSFHDEDAREGPETICKKCGGLLIDHQDGQYCG